MQIISNPAKIDFGKLESFVYNHPDTNFFQSTFAHKFFNAVDFYEPVLLLAESDGQYVGSLQGVIMKEGSGVKGYLSNRLIVFGGPLVHNSVKEVNDLLLKSLKSFAEKKSIYSQFRNLFDTNVLKSDFLNHGWEYEEHLDILVDLTKSEADLWKDVNSKRRNEIRRAEREGTTFDVLADKKYFPETYEILKDVYDRAKLPLPDYKFFETAYDLLSPEHFKAFLALNDNKIIGTMYTLCYKGVIYDWYAGSYREYYKKYPNDLIPWKVFLWGKENGFYTFDFGGAGKPDVPYGVRDYKKKFGGEFVNFGRYEQIHKPNLFNIAKLGFKLYQRFKL